MRSPSTMKPSIPRTGSLENLQHVMQTQRTPHPPDDVHAPKRVSHGSRPRRVSSCDTLHSSPADDSIIRNASTTSLDRAGERHSLRSSSSSEQLAEKATQQRPQSARERKIGTGIASAHSSYTSLASLASMASSNDLTELLPNNNFAPSSSNDLRDGAVRRRSRRHSLGCQTDGVADVAMPKPPLLHLPARGQASDLLGMLRPQSAQAGQPCSTIMSSDGADDSISPPAVAALKQTSATPSSPGATIGLSRRQILSALTTAVGAAAMGNTDAWAATPSAATASSRTSAKRAQWDDTPSELAAPPTASSSSDPTAFISRRGASALRAAVATAAAVGVAAMGGDDGGAAEVLTDCLRAGHDAEYCNVALAECLESCGKNDEECNVEHCVANYDLELCSDDASASDADGERGDGVGRGGARGMAAAREALRMSGGALAATMDGARATILDGMHRLTALCDQEGAKVDLDDLREFKRIMLLQYEALTRQTASSLEYLKTAETAMAATGAKEAAAAAKACNDTLSYTTRHSWDTLEDDTVEAMAENVERHLAFNAVGGPPPPLKLRPLMLREANQESTSSPSKNTTTSTLDSIVAAAESRQGREAAAATAAAASPPGGLVARVQAWKDLLESTLGDPAGALNVLATPMLATGLRALLFMAAKAPVMQQLEAGWNPVAISMLTGVGCCVAANLLSEVAVQGLAGSSRDGGCDWRAAAWGSMKQTSLTRMYLGSAFHLAFASALHTTMTVYLHCGHTLEVGAEVAVVGVFLFKLNPLINETCIKGKQALYKRLGRCKRNASAVVVASDLVAATGLELLSASAGLPDPMDFTV